MMTFNPFSFAPSKTSATKSWLVPFKIAAPFRSRQFQRCGFRASSLKFWLPAGFTLPPALPRSHRSADSTVSVARTLPCPQLFARRSRSCSGRGWCGIVIRGWYFTCVANRAIDNAPKHLLRDSPCGTLAVDEQSGSSIDSERVALVHGRANHRLILFGDASLQLGHVHIIALFLAARVRSSTFLTLPPGFAVRRSRKFRRFARGMYRPVSNIQLDFDPPDN